LFAGKYSGPPADKSYLKANKILQEGRSDTLLDLKNRKNG